MRLLIAFLLPWLTFFTIGRPITGIICLVLQSDSYRMDSGDHLGGIRAQPVQDRSENQKRAWQPIVSRSRHLRKIKSKELLDAYVSR
jgi:hypothetical protein